MDVKRGPRVWKMEMEEEEGRLLYGDGEVVVVEL